MNIMENINPLNTREGMVPTILGTAVAATGIAMAATNKGSKAVAWGVAGFGLAHAVLGAIDLMEHDRY